MRVIVYGSGAREHALAWKISQSPLLEKLYLYKSNDGFSHLGEIIEAGGFVELKQRAIELNIDLIVVGPEAPLAEGVVDIMQPEIKVIGSDKYWTQLESSKSFAKEFMVRNNIPTAKYEILTKRQMPYMDLPYAIKADGLCGGKGVCIVYQESDAMHMIHEYMEGMFGEASKKIVIEELLNGPELSLMSLWDGKTLLPFISARDFKKLNEGDVGPNTGGMAAYCPVNLSDVQKQKLSEYVAKLEAALKKEEVDFTGVLYSGLIWNDNEFKVLEFNMRFGDPETQPLMMHLESDILEVLKKCSEGKLNEVELFWKEDYSACLTIASDGYPCEYEKGVPIENIPEDLQVFYAGVKKNPNLISTGGRVLSLCKTGKNPYNEIYNGAIELDFSEKFYRGDIKIV